MGKRLISLTIIICIIISLCACSNTTEDNEQAGDTTTSPLTALSDSSKYYGTTFGQGNIIDINVEISDDDWQDIKDNATAEEYHTANITVNGTTVNNVGFRAKGFSSLTSVANSDSDRYGFKVKMDEYVDNQLLNGLDTLVLNASFSDPSYMREYLTYAASQYLGGQTPYLAYSRLSINGELFGFYLCIEAYDDSFAERYSDSGDTVLYKAVSENCTLLTSDDGSGFDVDYGEDDDYSNIKNLISILNSTTSENKEELEKILDVDSVLKAIAVNTVTGNYDSYSGSKAHNYYLLYTGGKFSYIGWDYNMSMGGFSEDNGASVTVDASSPVYNVDISERPLIEKLLAIDEYYDRYMGYINSLTEYFSNFEDTVASIEDIIRDDVANDPSAFYTIDEFESNITASDTDLSQVQASTGGGKGMGGGPNMQRQDGDTTDTTDGYGQTLPEANSSSGEDGNRPSFPDGYDPGSFDGYAPDMSDGNAPGNFNGTMPDMQDGAGGNMQRPNGGGGMINQNVVSIVDYITQRIANINDQI